MERKVVRVVTPGTLTEEALLESRQENLLAALAAATGLGIPLEQLLPAVARPTRSRTGRLTSPEAAKASSTAL